MATFTGHREKIMLTLSGRVAILADSTHESTKMQELLRTLDNPDEKRLRDLVLKNGGPEACLNDEDKFKELLLFKRAGKEHDQVTPEISDHIRDQLEMTVSNSIENNLKQFNGKLEIQKNSIIADTQMIVKTESDRVIHAITSNVHLEVIDSVRRSFLSCWLDPNIFI